MQVFNRLLVIGVFKNSYHNVAIAAKAVAYLMRLVFVVCNKLSVGAATDRARFLALQFGNLLVSYAVSALEVIGGAFPRRHCLGLGPALGLVSSDWRWFWISCAVGCSRCRSFGCGSRSRGLLFFGSLISSLRRLSLALSFVSGNPSFPFRALFVFSPISGIAHRGLSCREA